ncbi:DNA protecting protein DprA [Candidatus Campbellbacteria bacterium RIFOXYC2_FULL_35_25]|uniref:DNA protecting protein DprA n=1 Tax=Candidatus Campbellbacteria bacterium RIFOXYC2_FULL_35_25 TaxID=1797582 RepID=A0A1F5EJ51_9BACT|nr:MAG: DNA protecting protein DprA [Candidatus Campbellbacteria bacterium RIFOXYC2_FULL_35_25]
MSGEIIKLSKQDFPEKLLEIPQPPKQLFIRGNLPDWENSKFVAVVGSRKYTNYGKEACEKIISGLRGCDVTIISGLAIGIDSIAHKSALEAKLKSIAVPGSGLNSSVIYPSINKKLADEIVQSGGCLLSEFEPDFRATVWSFPQRNRIMAGLSDVILIIEASEKSGTLITARMGVDYNKEVCAVPASIFSNGAKGSNKLLSQGATPITSSEDLLDLLGFQTKDDSGQKKLELENCSAEEKSIIELLFEPISRDELIQKSEMSASEINTLISIMEIKGLIKEVAGEICLNI